MTRRDYIAYAILVAIVALTIATVWVLGKTHHWRLGDSPDPPRCRAGLLAFKGPSRRRRSWILHESKATYAPRGQETSLRSEAMAERMMLVCDTCGRPAAET